jgi:cytochrome c-type biogenesis protein CcmH
MTRRSVWRWAPAAALVVVVVVVLAVGAGRSSHPTLDQRVGSLAGQVRCPVCSGETAAQSDTPPSVEIRSQIRTWLQQGVSGGQIKARLVAEYGPGILERPQASGISLLVWVLPLAAGAVAVAGLVAAFVYWRRRGRQVAPATESDRVLVGRAVSGGDGQ